VFIYNIDNINNVNLTATLSSPLGEYQGFGFSVGISDRFAVVGSSVNGAFIYEKTWNSNGGYVEWILTTSLFSSDVNGNETHFGFSVAIYGNFSVVGSYGLRKTFCCIIIIFNFFIAK
jgi:hypothetical protein